MSCWHSYCLLASLLLSMLMAYASTLVGDSTVAGIPALACLSLLLLTSLMFLFPIVSAAVYPSVASVLVESSCLLLLASMLNVGGFSTVADVLLSDSGGPADVDIYDVPIVPVAAVIPDVVGLPACFCNP
jgi:hypothetical protein